MKLFAQLTKVDVEKRQVWGRAVQEVGDKSGEIFDYDTSKPLFAAWSSDFEKVTDGKSLGNVRAMHGDVAAGKVISIDFVDAEKAIDIGAQIVDENEWQKCLEGVYTGFSIGGRYEKKWRDGDLTRYTASPSEVSIVDNPCIPTAVFSMVKAEGVTEEKTFQRYGLLKAAIGKTELSMREILTLAEQYLPTSEMDAVAKAESTIGDLRDRLQKLATDAPPAPVVPPMPVIVFKHLKKGMWSVSCLADILSSVANLAVDAEWEAAWEEDGSQIPDDLRAWLQMGVELFKRMSAEEADELIESITPAATLALAAKNGELAKLAAVTAIETDRDAALAKVTALTTEVDTLQKRALEAEQQRDEVATEAEKVVTLYKQATEALTVRKGTLRVVTKESDQSDLVDKKDEPTDPVSLIKKAQQSPMGSLVRPPALPRA